MIILYGAVALNAETYEVETGSPLKILPPKSPTKHIRKA